MQAKRRRWKKRRLTQCREESIHRDPIEPRFGGVFLYLSAARQSQSIEIVVQILLSECIAKVDGRAILEGIKDLGSFDGGELLKCTN